MKLRIITTLALLSGLLSGGCMREDMPGHSGEGNRVVFTLAGITPKDDKTRASGDNDAARPDPTAATDGEKKVTTLIAAAYEKQSGSGKMGFYKAFDVTVSDQGCSFDIAKEGRFDLYLVANADPTLAGKIKALGAASEPSELEALVVDQAPDADNAFIMTTPEALKIISYSGEVADCGEVTLRRLSMRIDLLNKAEGLTINKVTFRNRVVKSCLFTPNAMISGSGVTEDKEYADLNLVGNFETPAECKSKIYGYENLSRAGTGTLPTLDIEYTFEDQTYTHTVEFLDAKDPAGLTPLALKRNYLYRITVGRKVEPEFNIEVVDWVNDGQFNVDDITFQAAMNAKLAINHFAATNVKTLDEEQRKITFTTENHNSTALYTVWSDQWASRVYLCETDNTYYRVPTKEEAYLLFPDAAQPITLTEPMDGQTEVTETLPEKLFGSETKNGGEGKSRFKNVAAPESSSRVGGVAYPLTYALRFKGTPQYAAYRYEVKNHGNTETGEVEIRIKALQPNSLLTLDEVANEAYWGNPTAGNSDEANQLVIHIPATGYKTEADGNPLVDQGTNSFLWSTDSADGTNAYISGHNSSYIHAVVKHTKQRFGTLRMVKASGKEVADAEQKRRNDALKVNMFTPYNVLAADLASKKVTSFFDKLAVSKEDCPTTSYFTYEELKSNGWTTNGAVITDNSNNKYRLPTEGELNLLMPMWTEGNVSPVHHPWWNDNESTNTTGIYMDNGGEFTETIYLKNNSDGKHDDQTNPQETDGEYRISGKSWLKLGTKAETVHYYAAQPDDPQKGNFNIYPVYGLRFQGTSQCAAYRWESCKIASNPLERYFSIKIKALGKEDTKTTIDMVANEAFWKEGFIEFKVPASGYYSPSIVPDGSNDNISGRGAFGNCWSSSLRSESDSQARDFDFGLSDTCVGRHAVGHRFPLRLVKVTE